MDPVAPLVVLLTNGAACDEQVVGGKAAKLSRLASSGFRVPAGFCLTVAAYDIFVRHHRIDNAIRMELGRKNLDEMRWEEYWDAALRIRSLFLSNPLTPPLQEALRSALDGLEDAGALAVRSSALGEDSGDMSFAGLHESFTDVRTGPEIEKAVRLVWASLWSDAALLYRRELCLDPEVSRMAVLIQAMTHADRSGVAFGGDPRGGDEDVAIIEAVAGPCRLLVDGAADPDHWEIDRQSRKVVIWRPGDRDVPADRTLEPLLDGGDLDAILDAVHEVEDLFGWVPDMEWTGGSASLTILQARPITTAKPDPDKDRSRSMSLRPGDVRLRELRDLVADRLIPQLEEEGQRFSEERLEDHDDVALAKAIEQRSAALEKWKKVYWDLFIPFAHGVRRLATYYNDCVGPRDPYEFIGLLRNQPLLATQRNDAIRNLATRLVRDDALRQALTTALASDVDDTTWEDLREGLRGPAGAEGFIRDFEDMSHRFLDITFDKTRLQVVPGPVLRNILELSRSDGQSEPRPEAPQSVETLEQRLLDAVGSERRDEAREMIEIGRLSWKLRDDDNLLVSRVESQLLRGLDLAAARLRETGRAVIGAPSPTMESARTVVRALSDPGAGPVNLTAVSTKMKTGAHAPNSAEKPRQLIGQPASPGMASGRVRVLRGGSDLGKFRQGDVLVCDAIQPNMTHLAMLAAAIVERRGGMLIHGAIIARELGIPCVNGVRDAARILSDGDLVTVDGYLGILTVGTPELEQELRFDPEPVRSDH